MTSRMMQITGQKGIQRVVAAYIEPCVLPAVAFTKMGTRPWNIHMIIQYDIKIIDVDFTSARASRGS